MGYITGSAIPFKIGEKAKETCPHCEGEGTCPSFDGKIYEGYALYNGTIAPGCEYCGGNGIVSKIKLKKYYEEGW